MREINKLPPPPATRITVIYIHQSYNIHGMIKMTILVVYAASRLIIPIDSKQQDCLLHAW